MTKKIFILSLIFAPVYFLYPVCPDGTISFDPDGICINTLKVDYLSVTDIVAAQMIIAELSVSDIAIQGTFTIPSLSSAGILHNDSSGLLSSSLIVNTDVAAGAAIVDTKLATISTTGKVTNSATTAVSTNSANAIVARDASGNFSATTITANLSGNATNFTGSLVGDVTGTQGATVVSTVGGQTAANIAAAALLANAATNLNTASAIVRRDATGSFAAQIVSVVDGVISRNIVLSTNPSSSTAGNILKGSSRFIHNAGTNNTFMGVNAGNFTMTGTGQNAAFGVSSLTANTTGNNNVAVGYNALSACTTGSSNIAVGSAAGTVLTTGSNNIYIGSVAGGAAEANTIRIGTLGVHTACFLQGLAGLALSLSGVVVDSTTGKLGYLLSSRKFKKNIQDMGDVSSDVLNLRPVIFEYNDDETNTQQCGLIAEEVEEIFPAIVVRDENGEPKTVQYHILPVLLLNEIKKQHATIEKMDGIIHDLLAHIEKIMTRVEILENKA